MRAWFVARGVQLPDSLPMAPAAKAAQSDRLLGDGDGNGYVNFWDLFYLWNRLTDGYNWSWMDWDLLDINRDGSHGFDDLAILGDHLYKIPQPPNTYGIGQPVAAPITASLSPSPRSVRFEADGEDWKRFTVRVTGGASVIVVVNSLSVDDLVLEIHKGASAPNRSYCGAERNDSKTVVDGDIVWIAGCVPGNSSIFVRDADGNNLEEFWSIDVHPVRTADTFDIELIFVGGRLTARDQRLARQAADRWEQIITEGVEDLDVDLDTRDYPGDWLSFSPLGQHLRVQQTVDDLLVFVAVGDPEVYAIGGSFWVTDVHRPILGHIALSPDALAERDAVTENIFLHELGHVLGIGGGRWREMTGAPSEQDPTADTYFFGAGSRAAFHRVGGRDYRGNKVPVESGGDDSHWRESVFGSELMTAYLADTPEPLGEVTLHALADLGHYQVDVSQAEPYTLPPASKPVVTRRRIGRCGVIRPLPAMVAP